MRINNSASHPEDYCGLKKPKIERTGFAGGKIKASNIVAKIKASKQKSPARQTGEEEFVPIACPKNPSSSTLELESRIEAEKQLAAKYLSTYSTQERNESKVFTFGDEQAEITGNYDCFDSAMKSTDLNKVVVMRYKDLAIVG
mmetsp:Transcript_32255/g.40005  ORF Transcript_32255/g.40005 Transcript_32255/m.40005 type:complete len:143 (+) Transcript_32255:1439-1867(+)